MIITTPTLKPEQNNPPRCGDHSRPWLLGPRRPDRPILRVVSSKSRTRRRRRRRWVLVVPVVLPVLLWLTTTAFGRASPAFSWPTPLPPPTPASKIVPVGPPLPSCVGRVTTTISVVVPPAHQNDDDDAKETEVRTKIVNYYVIGTSHFRCQSYQEVAAVLLLPKHHNTPTSTNTPLRTDGCVIELDPERTVRLTLDDAMVAASLQTPRTTTTAAHHRLQKRWFGGDFLAAIETSKDLDIPLFLGDESPLQTRQRLFDIFDLPSYDGTKLRAAVSLALFGNTYRRRDHEANDATTSPTTLYVDVLGTFRDDPQKLIPVLVTVALPLLTVILLGLTLHPPPPPSALSLSTTATAAPRTLGPVVPTVVAVLLSYLLTCKVYNTVIVDRDRLIAATAHRAAPILVLLQAKELIRKRWTFSSSSSSARTTTRINTNTVNTNTRNTTNGRSIEENDTTSATVTAASHSRRLPLFTLKTPLEKNATRTLNLFEPRWLKMMETLQEQQQSTIGCVTCVNKFYSAVNLVAEDDKATKSSSSSSVAFAEGRYADVIFQPRGRYATVQTVTESSRPSGARKLVTEIVGHESFAVPTNPTHITMVPDDGYLSVAPAHLLRPQRSGALSSSSRTGTTRIDNTPHANATSVLDRDKNGDDDEENHDDNDTDEINIVVVVGLLHANGVLQCLANSTNTNNNNNKQQPQ